MAIRGFLSPFDILSTFIHLFCNIDQTPIDTVWSTLYLHRMFLRSNDFDSDRWCSGCKFIRRTWGKTSSEGDPRNSLVVRLLVRPPGHVRHAEHLGSLLSAIRSRGRACIWYSAESIGIHMDYWYSLYHTVYHTVDRRSYCRPLWLVHLPCDVHASLNGKLNTLQQNNSSKWKVSMKFSDSLSVLQVVTLSRPMRIALGHSRGTLCRPRSSRPELQVLRL